jgi:hypothetical protein
MGQRVSGYVQFIREVGNLKGTSGEVKEQAVADFFERMDLLVRALERIQDTLRLG